MPTSSSLVLAHVDHGLVLAEVGDQVVVGEHDPVGRPVVPLE